MKAPNSSGWEAAAWAAVVPVLLLPIGDPDLWWHLNTGRWIAENLRVPRVELFSYTLGGVPWVDFEWLSQLLLHAVHSWGGLPGLWVFKILLFAAVCAGVCRLFTVLGVRPVHRALGLALWAAVVAYRAEARTEMFSLLGFICVLVGLRLREDSRQRVRVHAAASFLLFALWANLHLGFVYGLAVIGVEAAAEWIETRRLELCAVLGAALAGTLVNPYGWGLYAVAFSHAGDAALLERFIPEWGPLDWSVLTQAPLFFLTLAGGAVAVIAWRRGRRPRAASFVLLLLFGAAALRHARAGAFFAALLIPYLLTTADTLGWLKARRQGERAVVAALVLVAFFGMLCAWKMDFPYKPAYARNFPRGAAEYMDRNLGLETRRVFHSRTWGGYLAHRLGPELRVFQDGRYLFHGMMPEQASAASSPAAWGRYLDRHEIDTALLERTGAMSPAGRPLMAEGGAGIPRPAFTAFMPMERWALVYWDRQSLLFVRRGSIPPGELARREFRILLPGDLAWIDDRLKWGEIREEDVNAELERHIRLLAEVGESVDRDRS